MKELILTLVLSHLTYPVDIESYSFKAFFERLKIVQVAPSVIEHEVCGGIGACDGNYTFAYDYSRNLIQMPDTCGLENERCKAALMHEMVHFIQNYTGKHKVDASCYDDMQLEVEAYLVQHNYLQRVDIDFGFIHTHYAEYFLAQCLLQASTNQ
jgi:hypothetical protein